MNEKPEATPEEMPQEEKQGEETPAEAGNGGKDGQAAPKKRPRLLVRIIGNILLLLATFLILEGLVRITPYNPSTSALLAGFVNPEWRDENIFELHPDLFWRFRPNQIIQGRNEEQGEYEIPINNLGFRGPNFPDGKEEGRVRLMYLGDSCVFGWSAPVGMNFPERLHRSLSTDYPDRNFHFFQGGVPGYTSYQAKQVLKLYGTEYEPHLVIVYLGTNDTVPAVSYPDDEIMARGKMMWEGQRYLEKSYLFLAIRDLLSGDHMTTEQWNNRYENLDWKEGEKRVSLEDFGANLEWITQYARDELGAQVVFVTRQSLAREPAVVPYNKRMMEVGDSLHVPVVDVASYFASVPNPASLYHRPDTDKIHPNSEGYGIVARMVYSTIRENDMIENVEVGTE